MTTAEWIKTRPAWLLGLLFPQRCPLCDTVLDGLATCPDCAQARQELKRAVPRLAASEHDFYELDGAASLYWYKDAVREAVHRMKYGGRACYCETFGRELAAEIYGCTFAPEHGIINPIGAKSELWRMQYDCVVPVPPSYAGRGYHVTRRLAAPLAAGLGLPLCVNALYKTRETAHQAQLTREERLQNVIGAFAVHSGTLPENARVLLVDDIITTGATVSACAQALRKAGAAEVFAVSVAVSEEEMRLAAHKMSENQGKQETLN